MRDKTVRVWETDDDASDVVERCTRNGSRSLLSASSKETSIFFFVPVLRMFMVNLLLERVNRERHRKIRPHNYTRMRESWLAGRFHDIGQPIVTIDPHGVVVNGFHRLTLLKELDIELTNVWVSVLIDEEAAYYIDTSCSGKNEAELIRQIFAITGIPNEVVRGILEEMTKPTSLHMYRGDPVEGAKIVARSEYRPFAEKMYSYLNRRRDVRKIMDMSGLISGAIRCQRAEVVKQTPTMAERYFEKAFSGAEDLVPGPGGKNQIRSEIQTLNRVVRWMECQDHLAWVSATGFELSPPGRSISARRMAAAVVIRSWNSYATQTDPDFEFDNSVSWGNQIPAALAPTWNGNGRKRS